MSLIRWALVAGVLGGGAWLIARVVQADAPAPAPPPKPRQPEYPMAPPEHVVLATPTATAPPVANTMPTDERQSLVTPRPVKRQPFMPVFPESWAPPSGAAVATGRA